MTEESKIEEGLETQVKTDGTQEVPAANEVKTEEKVPPESPPGGEKKKEEAAPPEGETRAEKRIRELIEKNTRLETQLALQTEKKEEEEREVETKPDPALELRPAEEVAAEFECDAGFVNEFDVRTEKTAIKVVRQIITEEKKKIQERKEEREKEFQDLRTQYDDTCADAEKDFGGDEFGHVLADDRKGGVKHDVSSQIYLKAMEILKEDPKLQNSISGVYSAIARAYKELLKGNKAKPTKKEDETLSLPTSRGGTKKTASIQPGAGGWKPTKTLNGEEFKKLTPDQRELYQNWELSMKRQNKWPVK